MSKTDEPLLGTNFAQTDNEERKVEPMENQKGTRELFLETLTKIGCQYEFSEEENDDRIFFAYQGEHFIVDYIGEVDDRDYIVIKLPLHGDGYILYPEDHDLIL